jgi:hypothetical protein
MTALQPVRASALLSTLQQSGLTMEPGSDHEFEPDIVDIVVQQALEKGGRLVSMPM